VLGTLEQKKCLMGNHTLFAFAMQNNDLSHGEFNLLRRLCNFVYADDGIGLESIFAQYNSTTLTDVLNTPFNYSFPKSKILLLRHALAEHRKDIVEYLMMKGASVNLSDSKGPLLFGVLLDDSQGTIEMLRWLLSFPVVQLDNIDGLDHVVKSVCRSKQYWIQRAKDRPSFNQVTLDGMGLGGLPRFDLSLVGQQYAQHALTRAIIAEQVDSKHRRPVVCVLGGPPGHGKTETGKKLCEALSLDSSKMLKVSCANVNSPMELFGAAGAYMGSEVGSELNNFVLANARDGSEGPGHSGLCVVILDEFDKLDEEVMDGFFTVFDKGEWVDKKLSRRYQTHTVPCPNVIWLLTTNCFDSDVRHLFDTASSAFSNRNFSFIRRKIRADLWPVIKARFRSPLARRITHFIPYVPFNPEESFVITAMEVDHLREDLARPRCQGKHIGHFNLQVAWMLIGAPVSDLAGYVASSCDIRIPSPLLLFPGAARCC
jgi:hypothetical protein